jgi:hypothetical protein
LNTDSLSQSSSPSARERTHRSFSSSDTRMRMHAGLSAHHISSSSDLIGTNANATELSATPYGMNSFSPCRIAPQV